MRKKVVAAEGSVDSSCSVRGLLFHYGGTPDALIGAVNLFPRRSFPPPLQ